jgi:phosphate starvation-inducible membrane PsiE
MTHYSSSVYALWFLGMILQLLACWTVVERGYFARWKAFSYYLFCMTASSGIGILAALFGGREIYRYIYAGTATLEAIFLCLVVFEIMVNTLEPFESLPGRLVARFGYWAALGIAASVALSVSVGSHSAVLGVGPALTVERTVFLADAMLLWLLLFQARALGVTWESSVAEIAIAFVLYLTVQAAVRFVVIIYETNDQVVNIANGFGQFAYMISLCAWIWTMKHRDPMTVHTSPEKLAQVQALASQQGAVPKERIFAAVGIKINKIETDGESAESEQPAKILLN